MSHSFSRNLKSYFQTIDKPLFIVVVAISLLGAISLWGVAGADSLLFKKQLIFIATGLSVMIIFSFFNYRYLKNYPGSQLLDYIRELNI